MPHERGLFSKTRTGHSRTLRPVPNTHVLSEKPTVGAVGSPAETNAKPGWVGSFGRWASEKPWLLAFWLAALGGFAISVFTPPMLGGDEVAHFTRAYQLATGDVLTHRDHGAYGAYLPTGVISDIE